MLSTKTDFESLGMGITALGGWVEFQGQNIWVSMLATSETRRGQKRDWCVSAEHHVKGKGVVRVMCQQHGFRYEAADAALAELLNQLAGAAAPQTLAA